MRGEPYVHLWRKGDKWVGVCAIRMAACPVERANASVEEIAARHLRRQVDWINALFCPSRPRVYALRYFSRPHPTSFAAGEITVALLAKVEGDREAACREQAQALCHELGALLGGMFPDYIWRTVTEREEFERLWTPFEWDGVYIAEIRRREDRVSLATVRPRPMLGRGRALPESSGRSEETVYFVHSFIPPATTMARLLRTMLLQRAPVLLQVGLAPVWLDPGEEQALVAEIARAERYAHGQELLPATPVAASTVLLQRAQAVCEGLLRQFLRLQDAPFLMHILLASPEPLPPTLLEAVGVEVTAPVGGSGPLSVLQMGGYDVAVPSNPEDRRTALSNLREIEFTPWGDSLAPPALRRARWLVDAQEAAGAFRFPLATAEGLPGLEVWNVPMRPVPHEAVIRWQQTPPAERILIGENSYLGFVESVFLTEWDRRQHVYIVGQTGTGKTTLLKTMIVADMEAGRGLAVIDPHGDLFHELLTRIPPHRADDVIVLDPTDMEYPIGLNILEYRDPYHRYFVVREMRAIMERLLEDQYGAAVGQYAGPVFFQHLQKSLLLVMSRPNDPGTLLEFFEIYQTPNFWKKWTPLAHPDPLLERWLQFLEDFDPTYRYSEGLSWGEWISSKFEDFLLDPKLRRIFGQKRSTIDLGRIMDEGKILLVNLAKGELAEANARFLGMVLMAKILATAIERVTLPPERRRTFYLYVDEFQALATKSFILLLSEARKFGLSLVLANQFLSQVQEPIVRSIFGNVGTIISFRVSQADAQMLEPYFAPSFDALALTGLPNWHACARLTVRGQSVTPFMFRTILLPDPADPSIADRVRQQSRQRYGRHWTEVEEEIRRSLTFPESPDDDAEGKE
jgi:hypothetical protein